MEAVWRLLKGRPPVMPRSTINKHLRAGWSKPDGQWTDREAALALFFCYAYLPMAFPFKATTAQKLETLRDLCTRQAAQLRASAEWLRGSDGVFLSDGLVHAANVEAAAAACDG